MQRKPGQVRAHLDFPKSSQFSFQLSKRFFNPSRPDFGEGEGTAASAMKRGVFGRINLPF